MSSINAFQLVDVLEIIAAIASLLAAFYSVYSVYDKRHAEIVYLEHLFKKYSSTELGLAKITKHRLGLEKVRDNQYESNLILMAEVFDVFDETLSELSKNQQAIIRPALRQRFRNGRVDYMLKLLDALERKVA